MAWPLRDRLAELIRRSRLGNAGGDYANQPEQVKEEWRKSADAFLREARAKGVSVNDDWAGA
jgi:hypothetical protein